jgi:hypothetical protein
MKKFFSLTLLMLNLSAIAQWELVGPRGCSNFDAFLLNFNLDHSDVPYFTFRGWKSGATVMKYSGNWDTVGVRNFSEGLVVRPKISFDQTNTPFVIYSDITYGGSATIRHFDGTNWVTENSLAFTTGPSSYCSMAFCPVTGTPYMAYRDKIRSYRCSVMKYNGSSWEFVGTPGFSTHGYGGASNIDLKFNSEGTSYVSFLDQPSSWRATVAKFDGSDWVYLDQPGFANGSPSLLIDHSDNIYIAYADGDYSQKISVQKFNGSTWEYVGLPGFSVGYAEWVRIDCDAKNNLFVAYADGGLYGYVSVKKFNGSNWDYVGDSTISGATVSELNLKIDRQGNAYVAYADGGVSNFATVKKFPNAGQAVGIREIKKEENPLLVQPNPSNGLIRFSARDLVNKECTLQVMNSLGTIVLSKDLPSLNTEEQLDLGFLPKGVYTLRLRSKILVRTGKLVLH